MNSVRQPSAQRKVVDGVEGWLGGGELKNRTPLKCGLCSSQLPADPPNSEIHNNSPRSYCTNSQTTAGGGEVRGSGVRGRSAADAGSVLAAVKPGRPLAGVRCPLWLRLMKRLQASVSVSPSISGRGKQSVSLFVNGNECQDLKFSTESFFPGPVTDPNG